MKQNKNPTVVKILRGSRHHARVVLSDGRTALTQSARAVFLLGHAFLPHYELKPKYQVKTLSV